jgi:hypothetical protein
LDGFVPAAVAGITVYSGIFAVGQLYLDAARKRIVCLTNTKSCVHFALPGDARLSRAW